MLVSKRTALLERWSSISLLRQSKSVKTTTTRISYHSIPLIRTAGIARVSPALRRPRICTDGFRRQIRKGLFEFNHSKSTLSPSATSTTSLSSPNSTLLDPNSSFRHGLDRWRRLRSRRFTGSFLSLSVSTGLLLRVRSNSTLTPK